MTHEKELKNKLVSLLGTGVLATVMIVAPAINGTGNTSFAPSVAFAKGGGEGGGHGGGEHGGNGNNGDRMINNLAPRAKLNPGLAPMFAPIVNNHIKKIKRIDINSLVHKRRCSDEHGGRYRSGEHGAFDQKTGESGGYGRRGGKHRSRARHC